jgi:hypothetical protein
MAVVAVETGTTGAEINIEVDEVGDSELSDVFGNDPTRGPVARLVARAARPLFREGLELIGECAREVVAKIEQMGDERPDSFEMELAVKLDDKIGAKLVEVTGGAQLLVRLRWERSGSVA